MKKNVFKRRIIATLLVLILLSSYMPIIVNATNTVVEESKTNTVNEENKTNTVNEASNMVNGTEPNITTYATSTTTAEDTDVEIQDEYVKGLLLEYDEDNNGKLSSSELAKVTELRLYGNSDIYKLDLIDLEKLTNLTTLYVGHGYDYDLKNIASIGKLTSLENLSVSGYYDTQGTRDTMDLSFLYTLPNLQNLSLTSIDASNVIWNSVSNKLNNLTLNDANIKNIDFITRFTNLTYLNLYRNEIEDITPLENLGKLESLYIDCVETNFATIEKLNLNSLHISQNIDINDVYVEKGSLKEIDSPTCIKKLYDSTSKLYIVNENSSYSFNINNLQDSNYNDYSEDCISFNDDYTKFTVDATKLNVGKYKLYIYAYGYNTMNENINANIYINFTVHQTGDTKQEIEIPDSHFKKLLLEKFDADKDKIITQYDMLQIKELYLYTNGAYDIKDVTGIEYAKNLESLTTNYNNLNGLTKINELASLRRLCLRGDNVKYLPEITILNQLTELEINNSSSTINVDYSIVGNLVNLKRLYINDTNTFDVATLEKLTNLETLTISARTANTELIGKLTNLDSLTLHTIDVLKEIDFISNLTKLTNLDLSDNLIHDIPPLKNLENLRYVNLLENPINTKFPENADTLKTLKDRHVSVNIVETNSTTNIEFKDENFKKTLINNSSADLNKDNEISIDEMQRLYSINISGQNKITSIEEIQYATNLSSLNIYTDIEDISPISKLTTVKYVYIRDTAINSFDIFKNMNLSTLDIRCGNYSSKSVFDLAGIENLQSIKSLSLSTRVKNVEHLKQLEYLNNLTINETIFDENDEQWTKEQVVSFLNELNIEKVHLNLNQSMTINLGKFVVGSKATVKFTEIDDFMKALYTSGNALYSEETEWKNYNGLEVDIANKQIEISTDKLGPNRAYAYVSGPTISANINFTWSNYLTGDTKNEINIPDKNLKTVLLEEYDIDGDKRITEQDMINILSLYISGESGKEISSLEGLQYAKNLVDISCEGNNISDLKPIADLEKLTYIYASNNLITDVTLLNNVKWNKAEAYIDFSANFINFENENENYKALKKFIDSKTVEDYGESNFEFIVNTQCIGDVSQIDEEVELNSTLKAKLIEVGLDTNNDGKISRRELYNPQSVYGSLDLSNSNISDISGLEYFMGYNINLSHNNISDITPITKNKRIIELDLSYNEITDISGIDNCYSIETLNLSNNNIENIEPITNLQVMKTETEYGRRMYVNLSNNNISNISCVKDWITLCKLDLSANKITDISSLKNYNFVISKNLSQEQIDYFAKSLTINLSENDIDMTKAGNKAAKKVFDDKGANLKLEDKSKATVYVTNDDGTYSENNNLGTISTELMQSVDFEYVPQTDSKLAGIFLDTIHYKGDSTHDKYLKDNEFAVEMIITGAIKTKSQLYNRTLTLSLPVPEEYIGNGAVLSTQTNSVITGSDKDTISINLNLIASETDNCYYTINDAVYLKIREQKIEDNTDEEEIIKAIQTEQNVTLDMEETITDVPNQVFETLSEKKDKNVELKIQTTNAVWKFNSDTITKNIEKPLNPTVTIQDYRFNDMQSSQVEDGIFIKFDHEGDLPGKAEIELDVGSYNNYEDGKTIYLYYYDSTKHKYQYISTVTKKDAKVTITLDHCSEYVLTDKMLYVMGDVNGDNSINTQDAMVVLRYSIGLAKLTDDQKMIADVNGSGNVDTQDAIKILRYTIGLEKF